MKPIPIHVIAAQLRKMPLHERITKLRVMLAAERPHSVRRNELQSLLDGAVTKQIKHEIRQARRAA